MVLIALLFVPCMIVVITIALPVFLFLAAVVAMVVVWYQSVVSSLRRPSTTRTPHHRHHHHRSNSTNPPYHVIAGRQPNAAPLRRVESTLRAAGVPMASFITQITNDVSASLLIPEPPPPFRYDGSSSAPEGSKLVTRRWSSTSRLVHLHHPASASAAGATSSLISRSNSTASLLYRRDYDFDVAPRRRVRFG